MLCQFLLYRRVAQSCVYTDPLFFGFPPHLGQHRALSRVPQLYSRFPLVIHFVHSIDSGWSFPGAAVVKNSPPLQEMQEVWSSPWVGMISWIRKWQPTPVFLPGKRHGQRSLAGYSSQGRKLDKTEQLSTHTSTATYVDPNLPVHPAPHFPPCVHTFVVWVCVFVSFANKIICTRAHMCVLIYNICFPSSGSLHSM